VTCQIEQFKSQTRLCDPRVKYVKVALMRIKDLKTFKRNVKQTPVFLLFFLFCISFHLCVTFVTYVLLLFCFSSLHYSGPI